MTFLDRLDTASLTDAQKQETGIPVRKKSGAPEGRSAAAGTGGSMNPIGSITAADQAGSVNFDSYIQIHESSPDHHHGANIEGRD